MAKATEFIWDYDSRQLRSRMMEQRQQVAGITAGAETEGSCLVPQAKSRDSELGLG